MGLTVDTDMSRVYNNYFSLQVNETVFFNLSVIQINQRVYQANYSTVLVWLTAPSPHTSPHSPILDSPHPELLGLCSKHHCP